jgi:hypothetical protein
LRSKARSRCRDRNRIPTRGDSRLSTVTEHSKPGAGDEAFFSMCVCDGVVTQRVHPLMR